MSHDPHHVPAPGLVLLPGGHVLLGVSKGAELALLLASCSAQVRATVAVVPANVVFQSPAFPSLYGSSWSREGQGLPYARFPWIPLLLTGAVGAATGRLRFLHRRALEAGLRDERAIIPVERIQAPIQLVSATHDQSWPSTIMCELIMTRLARHGVPYPHEHVAIESDHRVLAHRRAREAIGQFLGRHVPVPS